MTTYALDATGDLAANHIQGEVINLADAQLRRFQYVPLAAGPFYTTGLSIIYTDPNGVTYPWVNGVDYVPCFRLVGAVDPTSSNLVHAGIAPSNASLLGTISVAYHAFGGAWSLNQLAVESFASNNYYNPNVAILELLPTKPLFLAGVSSEWKLDTFAKISQAMDELKAISLRVAVKYTGLQPLPSLVGPVGPPGIQGPSGAVGFDLTGVNTALHRSPNPIVAQITYDASKDSCGGAWIDRTQGTSWYNEALNNEWLGQYRRAKNAIYKGSEVGQELALEFSALSAVGFTYSNGAWSLSNKAGTLAANAIAKAGKVYQLTYTVVSIVGSVAPCYPNLITNVASSDVVLPGTYVEYLEASANGLIGLRATGLTTMVVSAFSVKEVILGTAKSKIGDYFQDASDGKFYKIAEGNTTIEVFRGNKAKFPRAAAIIVEASSLTIYDLTESGRPMWMRFQATGTLNQGVLSYSNLIAVAFINGMLYVGTSGSNAQGLIGIDFIKDYAWMRTLLATNGGRDALGLALRNTGGHTFSASQGAGNPVIASATVNALAVAVFTDSPVDLLSGIQVPTVLVATPAGVSIIKPDGTAVTVGTVNGQYTVTFLRAGRFWVGGVYGSQYAEWVGIVKSESIAAGYIAVGPYPIRVNSSPLGSKREGSGSLVVGITHANQVFRFLENAADPARALFSLVTSAFSTGWSAGTVARIYLCNTEAETINGAELITDGQFASDLSYWNPVGNATWNAGAVTLAAASGQAAIIKQAIATVVGKIYRIQFTKLSAPGINSDLYIYIGTSYGASNVFYLPAMGLLPIGTYSYSFTAVGTISYLYIFNNTSASLSPVTLDSVSMNEAVNDRGPKKILATLYGELIKVPVAPGAQLVAYRNFSADNYIQELYSADLDFGVSEWTISAWMKAPVGLPLFNFPTVGSAMPLSAWTNLGLEEFTTASLGFTGVKSIAGGTDYALTDAVISAVVGRCYLFTIVVTANTSLDAMVSLGVGSNSRSNVVPIVGIGTFTGILNASATANVSLRVQLVGNASISVSSVSVIEVGPAIIVERAGAAGASIKLGLDAFGKIIATAYDGTTSRTVITGAPYNTGVFHKIRTNYVAGRLSIGVHGSEVASVTGTPLLSMNNSGAVLTIGNSRTRDAAFPGDLALVTPGATVQSAEQELWIHDQEKQMFQENVKITLPDATAVTDVAYDESRNKWYSVSTTNEASFTGFVRNSVTPIGVGTIGKITAGNGVRLLSRAGAFAGVDVITPAYSLREELLRRTEAANKLMRPPSVFDFDTIAFTATTTASSNQLTAVAGVVGVPYLGMGITGTNIPAGTTIIGINGAVYTISALATGTNTAVAIGQNTFTLQSGWTATDVVAAGNSVKREGATKDYIRLYDGFRETLRFGVSPGSGVWVKVTAKKE